MPAEELPAMELMDQFLLFGDSITQGAHSQAGGFGFGAALQDAYIRRLDIINRGLSGYNTDQAVKVLDRVIPDPKCAKLRFMTVFFGANDACWPTDQGVPLPQFTANLIKIFTHPLVQAQKDVRLILITPPPINEYMTGITDAEKGYTAPRRTAEHTKQYADAAREVGKDLNIAVLDLWTLIMLKAGWKPGDDPLPGSSMLPQNPVLMEMLRDGLHLSAAGYRELFNGLMELIKRVWPDQRPERLKFVLPGWNDRSGWKTYEASM